MDSKQVLEKDNIELAESASLTEAARHEVLAENVKKRKAKLIKLGAILALMVITLIFVTIAWFTMNRDVSGSGMSIKAGGPRFELAAKGNQIRNLSLFPLADSEYASGTSGTDPDDDSTYYRTGSETEQIYLRFTGTNDDAYAELEPGGSGVFEFYVIPNQDGDLSIDFNLNILGFIDHTYTVDEEEVTELIEITKLTTANSGLDADEITDRQDALDYLKGHILFFEEEGEPNLASGAYYYKTPIVDNVYHFEKKNAIKGKLYPVRIHWMWTNTLGQITLKDNSSGRRSGTPVVKDGDTIDEDDELTDKGAVIELIKTNKDIVFKSTTTITDSMIENSDDATNFRILSKGYNEADQMIGTYVRYFLLEVSTTDN